MRKAPYPNRPKQDKELNQSPEGWQAYCKALREESQGEKQIMSEIEKIQRYIERSNIPHNRHYSATTKKLLAIVSEMGGGLKQVNLEPKYKIGNKRKKGKKMGLFRHSCG